MSGASADVHRAKVLYPACSRGLSDEWLDVLDKITGHGNSPAAVRGCIDWLTSGMTQQEAAVAWDTSAVAIRNVSSAVIEAGPLDRKPLSCNRGVQS